MSFRQTELGSEQSKFADVTDVVARLQQQYDLGPQRPEDDEATKRGKRTLKPTKPAGGNNAALHVALRD
jgi:hypothetical protein